MKTKNLAYAGLKIFSIYIFILSWQSFMGAIQTLLFYNNQSAGTSSANFQFGIGYVVIGFINVGVILQIGLYIWFRAEKILAKIIPGSDTEKPSDKSEKLDPEKLLPVGFILIGVSVLVNAIPDLIRYIAEVIYFIGNSIDIRLTNPHTLEIIIKGIGSLVYIMLGLFLTFGAIKTIKVIGKAPKDLVKFIRKLRRD